MLYHQCDMPRPKQLAKNVPERGMHGYLPRLEDENAYWAARVASASDLADSGSEAFAQLLALNTGVCSKAGKAWRRQGVAANKPSPSNQTWEKWDNLRRIMLGVLALSMLCQDALPWESQQHLLDARAMPEGVREASILLEPPIQETGQRPLDTRLHLSGEVADFILDPYDGQSASSWYLRADGALYVRRAVPADPSEQYLELLMQEASGIRFDFASLHTLFPYLPAEPA